MRGRPQEKTQLPSKAPHTYWQQQPVIHNLETASVHVTLTLPETNSSPLKMGKIPI